MITRTRSCLRFSVPLFLVPLLCAPLISSVAVRAQQPMPNPAAMQQGGQPGQPSSRAIQLDVVVAPKSGPAVGGLTQNDFTVLDDKQPQTITSFKAFEGSQEPVQVVLLIDSVNTDFQTVAYERTEIGKFLRSNGGHLAHPVMLAVLTDNGIKVEQNSTSDGKVMAAALDKAEIGLRVLNRSTGFYGADERLQISLQSLGQLAGSMARVPGRKVILWLSPGWPLLSGPAVELSGKQQQSIFDQIVETSTQFRKEQVTVDAVNPLGVDEGVGRTFYYQAYLNGVKKPGDAQLADLSLQVIATQTGGQVLSSTGISSLLTQCMEDVAPFYRITFAAPPTEPGQNRAIYHSVEVKVSRPDVKALTSTGYYVP